MRHHIMQLARNAKTFLSYLPRRLPFLLRSCAAQTLLDLLLIAAPVAHDLAQEDHHREERGLLRHLGDLEDTRLMFPHHYDEEPGAEKEGGNRCSPTQIPGFYCGVEPNRER